MILQGFREIGKRQNLLIYTREKKMWRAFLCLRPKWKTHKEEYWNIIYKIFGGY